MRILFCVNVMTDWLTKPKTFHLYDFSFKYIPSSLENMLSINFGCENDKRLRLRFLFLSSVLYTIGGCKFKFAVDRGSGDLALDICILVSIIGKIGFLTIILFNFTIACPLEACQIFIWFYKASELVVIFDIVQSRFDIILTWD